MVLQIDFIVNAPEACTISEFFANEEDAVMVGQDLLKLELAGLSKGRKEDASSRPKEPVPTSSDLSTFEDAPGLESSTPASLAEKKPSCQLPEQQKRLAQAPKAGESKKTGPTPTTSVSASSNWEEHGVSLHAMFSIL